MVRIGALGDVLLTRRLTYSLSLAGIRSTLFAPARHASLLESDPWIDAVLDSESPPFAGAFIGAWPDVYRVFDLAVVISQSEDLARATREIAKSIVRIPTHSTSDRTSISRQWADAVAGFCRPFAGRLPLLPAQAGGASEPGATLIHPGSGSPVKNWPLDRFVELGRTLARNGHRVVWIMGPAEADLKVDGAPFPRLDQLPLRALATILAQARLLVGNDSGVSHLGAAVGTPTVAIFGPTNDRVFRPDGPRVETARAPSGSLTDVVEADVLASIRALLGMR